MVFRPRHRDVEESPFFVVFGRLALAGDIGLPVVVDVRVAVGFGVTLPLAKPGRLGVRKFSAPFTSAFVTVPHSSHTYNPRSTRFTYIRILVTIEIDPTSSNYPALLKSH